MLLAHKLVCLCCSWALISKMALGDFSNICQSLEKFGVADLKADIVGETLAGDGLTQRCLPYLDLLRVMLCLIRTISGTFPRKAQHSLSIPNLNTKTQTALKSKIGSTGGNLHLTDLVLNSVKVQAHLNHLMVTVFPFST